jgi:phage FluMu protein Com
MVVQLLDEFRCRKCNKLLGKIDGNAEIKCFRCGTLNIAKRGLAHLRSTDKEKRTESAQERR